jgi:hypothetical protein
MDKSGTIVISVKTVIWRYIIFAFHAQVVSQLTGEILKKAGTPTERMVQRAMSIAL